ncbi:MAG TPA: thiamine-phosphate kinase [Planctomycetota bacterium]|nr:thiamine-phosphate kinase [Planctomycetota bacterium]
MGLNADDGEEAFLERLIAARDRAADLPVPIGDDAAVFRAPAGCEIVAACDAICEGTHFRPGTPPEAIGRKALAVNLSDFAAMGAEPRFALVAASLPRGFSAELADRITAGLRRTAAEFGCVLAGGDTATHDGPLGLATTVIGFVRAGAAVRRDGARPGDVVAVTGALGGSFGADGMGRHLTFTPRLAEARALVAAGPPSAMMDVSDGLTLDLARLCRRSGVGVRLDLDRTPIHPDAGPPGPAARARAASDGEDFELLFTAPPDVFRRLLAGWRSPTPITAIGEIVPAGMTVVEGGVERPMIPRGYEHR